MRRALRPLLASVMMPAYGAEATLEEAVHSVLAQTVQDLELVVVDDASPVPVADVLAAVRDPRLRIVRRRRNGGTAAARNTALRFARAPLVAQLDADDGWERDYLETVLPHFDDAAIGLVYANAAIVGHPDGERAYIPDSAIHPIDRFPGLAAWNPIPAPTVTMRASAVRAVGGYARLLRSTEDYHLYLRLAAAGWRFAFVDRELARYRWPAAGRGKAGRERWHRSWELIMRGRFAARHPRVPGAVRAVAETAGRLVSGELPSRPRLAFVVGAYPQNSESFVLSELRELSRQAGPPPVLAMFTGDGSLDGAPPATLLGPATRAQTLRALMMLSALHPLRTAAALALPSRRFGASPREMVALAPRARGLAGVRHLHAHFATDPAALAGRLAALTGASFSFTAHAYDIYLVRAGLAAKLAAARFVVTPTEANRRALERLAASSPAKLHVVPNGIDLERFRRTTPYDPDGPLLAVGRLVPKKGFDVLVEAMGLAADRLPPLMLAGGGPEGERLAALAAERGARIEMLGPVPHSAVAELFERATAFALPCVELPNGDRDGAPTVLLEAMAMELPVLSTDLAGLEEVVVEDAGVLVPQRDAKTLADALVRVVELPAERRIEMGRAGRARAQREHDVRRQVVTLRHLFAQAGAM